MEVQLSTLCYLERDGKYLMLHRVVKKNDVNKDKWIGVGGHFERDESPEECLLREVREETGYTLTSYRFRGIVTFVSGDGVTEYMHLFTADEFTGEPIECDEGVLEWVPKEEISGLNIWEGDKIFFRLLTEEAPFFSLKLVYDGAGGLVSAVLDGSPMPLERKAAGAEGAAPAGVWEPAGCVLADNFSIAWRTYDAQYWGVAQRRRRIYLVADFATGRAGEILFESESVPWDSAKGREAWERASRYVKGSPDGGCELCWWRDK